MADKFNPDECVGEVYEMMHTVQKRILELREKCEPHVGVGRNTFYEDMSKAMVFMSVQFAARAVYSTEALADAILDGYGESFADIREAEAIGSRFAGYDMEGMYKDSEDDPWVKPMTACYMGLVQELLRLATRAATG